MKARATMGPASKRLPTFGVGRWIVSVVLAEAIGFALAMGFGRGIYALVGGEPPGLRGELFVLGLSMLAGVIEGLCLGAGQWQALRAVLPEVRGRSWLAATATGGSLAWMLGMFAGSHGPGAPPVPWVMAIVLVGSGLLLGAVLGGAQALVLRRRRGLARAWIAANAIGWAIGLLFVYAGIALTPAGEPTSAALALLVVSGAAMAILPALTTGLTLRSYLARVDG